MKSVISFVAVLCLVTCGCNSDDKADSSNKTGSSSTESKHQSSGSKDSKPSSSKGSTSAGNDFQLTSDNTKIEFVGTHAAANPKPRKGGFKKFSGSIQTGATSGKVKSISVTIETESIWTKAGGRLTNHLKGADFFDVREFPHATFESTNIAAGEGDQVTITGNLTLHGVKNEIEFPAMLTGVKKGVKLSASFQIDRTQFGMTYDDKKVKNMVELSISVGG